MKRGIKTIIAGCLVFLLGVFAPVLFMLPFLLSHEPETQFKVPGSAEFTLDKPGSYYLWNDYRTIYKGRSYNESQNIPNGMEIHIRDANSNELEFVSDTSATMNVGDSSKKSVGHVEIEHPEKVTIHVSGGNEDRIFSFSQFDFLKFFLPIVGGFGIFAVFALTGVGLIIWGIVKLARGNRARG